MLFGVGEGESVFWGSGAFFACQPSPIIYCKMARTPFGTPKIWYFSRKRQNRLQHSTHGNPKRKVILLSLLSHILLGNLHIKIYITQIYIIQIYIIQIYIINTIKTNNTKLTQKDTTISKNIITSTNSNSF
jgi:hypothetical protein